MVDDVVASRQAGKMCLQAFHDLSYSRMSKFSVDIGLCIGITYCGPYWESLCRMHALMAYHEKLTMAPCARFVAITCSVFMTRFKIFGMNAPAV